MGWFAAERQVLLAVTSLAVDAHFDIHAWQLPWAMAESLDRHGYWRDYAATQRTALAAASRLGDTAGQAIASRLLATACARLADYDEARTHLTRCLELSEQAGDQASQARLSGRSAGSLSTRTATPRPSATPSRPSACSRPSLTAMAKPNTQLPRLGTRPAWLPPQGAPVLRASRRPAPPTRQPPRRGRCLGQPRLHQPPARPAGQPSCATSTPLPSSAPSATATTKPTP